MLGEWLDVVLEAFPNHNDALIPQFLKILIPHMAQGCWETVQATFPLRHSTLDISAFMGFSPSSGWAGLTKVIQVPRMCHSQQLSLNSPFLTTKQQI